MLALPVFSFVYLKKKFDLNLGYDLKFKIAFGTLFQGVDEYKPSVYQMNTLFCLRRLLVAFFTVYLNSPLIINIFINIYSSLWIIKFYFQKTPMSNGRMNNIELLNEII